MKTSLCVIWMLTVTLAMGQEKPKETLKENIPTLDQIKIEPINTGYSFKLHSKVLHDERTIMVALPDDYEKSTKRYPVFYMVDAQWNFKQTTQAIQTLSNNGVIPQLIYIAIHTGDNRDNDLLPTRSDQSKTGGGADTLIRFIKEELFPFVEKNYRTSAFRILSGASYGGVFVMHTFLTEPKLFNAYLSESPSMWWDYRILLKRTEDFLLKNPNLQNYLYAAVANEGLGMGVDALANLLTNYSPKGLKWKFDQYPEEIHGTVTYKGTYNGLKFVFSEWLSEPINFDTKGDLVSSKDTVIAKVNSFSKIVRYTLNGSEPTVNSPLYEKPFVFTKPTILKVIPFYGYGIPGNCDSLVVHYLPVLTPETGISDLKNGLKYFYYEGDWDKLPDYSKLTPVKSGTTNNFTMNERLKDNNFGMRYTGYIDIPKDNVYSFYLSSDDGSQLLIGDTLVVNNDGLHGVNEKKGKIYLKKGYHRMVVLFFQKGGGFALNLEYESSDISKQNVPGSALLYSEK
jgi:predicted alpha/beta superfamily hydrolase